MITSDKQPLGQGDWSAATWTGARREAMRRWAALPVEGILAAQEEMADLGGAFGAAPSARESRRGHGSDADGHELVLAGCQATPLASYLKALGVLRLVAEQVDAGACGYWHEDQFVLTTRLSEEELVRFFTEHYCPTPVLAPWNGGSGFYPKDNRAGIEPIERGAAQRLAVFREAIATMRTELQGRTQKPEGEAKTRLLERLRNELGEQALDWLDAAVLLTEEKPKYPPLLGTGGNDGRLDFTNNFMRHLVALIDADSGEPHAQTPDWLREALFAHAMPGLGSAAVGQFSPGEAGGPNQATGYSGDALFNSWDFVLMLEGALLFAAAATRRLGSSAQGALSYPFTVRPTGAGSGGSALGDENNARAELWAPLWSAPTGLAELRALLAEGRATMANGRPARSGLDFARAVSRLGVDRGITAFQRFAFLMRSGKAFFATPLNRIAVSRNPAADLIDDLDQSNWLTRFRGLARDQHASARVQSLARRLEDAIFELTLERLYPAAAIEHLLMVLGEIQLYLARSPAAREKCRPVPSLSRQWLSRLEGEGGDSEIELAAALAGLHGSRARPGSDRSDWVMPMRVHLAPEQGGPYPVWNENAGHAVTWGRNRLQDNLAATLRRRLLEAEQLDLRDKPLDSARGASLAAIAGWLGDEVDERRLASLLPGLMLVRIAAGGQRPQGAQRVEPRLPLPAAYYVLKPFFCPDRQLRDTGFLAGDDELPLPPGLVRKLATDQVNAAVDEGLRRLRASGLRVAWRRVDAGVAQGSRLLAALLVPVGHRDLKHLRRQIQPMEEE
jgi:CRISPR-associated protein Csx17